jgi:hypothetical protein
MPTESAARIRSGSQRSQGRRGPGRPAGLGMLLTRPVMRPDALPAPWRHRPASAGRCSPASPQPPLAHPQDLEEAAGEGRREADHLDAVALRPSLDPGRLEVRGPADLGAERRDDLLDPGHRTVRLTEMVGEHDAAAGTHHAEEFGERGLRIRHQGDEELRHHRVEARIGIAEAADVHDLEPLDVGQPLAPDFSAGALEHVLGEIDAADEAVAGIVAERQAGADAGLQHPRSMGDRRLDGGPGGGFGELVVDDVVDRRPAGIALRISSVVGPASGARSLNM